MSTAASSKNHAKGNDNQTSAGPPSPRNTFPITRKHSQGGKDKVNSKRIPTPK